MPIRILSDVVAAQIAAGEVVERPASVIKELIENALDAGATAISIEVERGGKRSIRVSDDGSGIPVDEAELAFARHSTSKLATVDDLERIHTLGFRGEALASIASVSRATLTTRHRDAAAGARVVVEGGTVTDVHAAGGPVGTVVTVEDLFYNTPARLKFLKAESTERKHISQLVMRYAMAYADVRFRLVQEGREQFSSTGSGVLEDVLLEAYGLETVRGLLDVRADAALRSDAPQVTVSGFTSMPQLTRANRSQIIFFVNGRLVVDQSMTYAVVQCYRDLLPTGRQPVTVLLIQVPPEDVDVNVHPTKAEVRFRVPDAVFAAIQRAVRTALAAYQSPPGWQGDGGAPASDSAAWQTNSSQPEGPTNEQGAAIRELRPLIPGERQLRMELAIDDPGRFAPRGDHERGLEDSAEVPAGPEAPARPRTLPILRVVGQIGAMYIIAEGPAGLYLIDQFAAHMRVLYENVSETLSRGESVTQQPVQGDLLDVPARLARVLESNLDMLERLGFSLDLFGPTAFRIRAVPVFLAQEELNSVLSRVAEVLGNVGDEDEKMSILIEHMARLGAYKAGQVLNYDEMTGLIKHLERCANPRFAPGGNPILLHISGDELARQFGK